jgi:hypothetical protein
MSYGSKTPGKDVWGTPNYKILLVSQNTEFDDEFSGKLTLYERRWEKLTKDFTGLEEFIAALKDLWKESLRHGNIQDARLARWIEEYLIELKIKVSYEDTLAIVKGESKEAKIQTIEQQNLFSKLLSNERKVEITSDTKLLGKTDEFIPKVHSISLEDLDLGESTDEFLNTLIEKHKPTKEKEIKSGVTFIDENGKERTIDREIKVEDSATTGNSKVKSGLRNDFGFEIKDIEIEDKIPYSFTIEDISITGSNATKTGETMEQDGLKVTWNIPSLSIGEEVKMEYYLGNRLMRTVVSHAKEEVFIVNTYEPIIKSENRLYVDAQFNNNSGNELIKVKIIDQIPQELDLLTTDPTLSGKNRKQLGKDAIEVHWEYDSILPDTEYGVHYDLKERPYIIRDIYELITPEGNPLVQIAKVIKPLKLQSGFGVIFSINPLVDINDKIEITDELQGVIDIQPITNNIGTISVSSKDSQSIVTWIIENAQKGVIEDAYLRYKPKDKLENTVLKTNIGGKSVQKEVEYQSKREEETMVLPMKFYKEVDTR